MLRREGRMKEYELWVWNGSQWVFYRDYDSMREALEDGRNKDHYQVRMFSGRVLAQYGNPVATPRA